MCVQFIIVTFYDELITKKNLASMNSKVVYTQLGLAFGDAKRCLVILQPQNILYLFYHLVL